MFLFHKMNSPQYFGQFVLFGLISCFLNTQGDYTVTLLGDNEIVLGGTGVFVAKIFYDNVLAEGKFKFSWIDNGIPANSFEMESELPVSFWNVTFDLPSRPPGPYSLQVVVSEKEWYGYRVVASQRHDINVTLFLTGQMSVTQKDEIRDSIVATNVTTVHTLSLSRADLNYVQHSKNQVRTFWFVDCMYIGPSDNLSLPWVYRKVDAAHYVEAIVLASYIPPPPTTTTTTTTTSTILSTTSATTTATTPSTPTPASVSNVTTTSAPHINATVVPADPWIQFFSSFPLYNESQVSAGFCINMSTVPPSVNDTYGYFNKKLITKDGVGVVRVNGNNWLQEGALLNMSVTVNGSAPLFYCMPLLPGIYNVTGNETCDSKIPVPPSMSISLSRLFINPGQSTYLLILENQISRLVTPIGVNVYQVKKQPQISVIVVPVVFSIAAVILVVFGVAWYVHTRRTFPVEVADFDFGQQSNDMEYKTFRERLRDSVMASFFRAGDSEDTQEDSWSPNRKYGSMQ